ncbi:hypothetical protein ACF068_29185 [Streptomyces sp. NPDC016309]|uniref:hypothetical protein n=1 Tax=Streptomyces sp. NPDC016309 TaxID=3364965 RepID=UPI0036FE76CA
MIGLASAQRGRWEGDEVVVDLHVTSAGVAVRASHQPGRTRTEPDALSLCGARIGDGR